MKVVVVEAPARLHLGFIDLSGALGRRFGSIGLAISDISTRLCIQKTNESSACTDSPEAERVMRYADLVLARLGISERPSIAVEEYIPGHAGLGSGTQLALAVGRGIAEIHALELTTAEIAAVTNRGARSGIGISVFDSGGFVVDLGRGQLTKTPPELCRLAFPEQWRVLLVTDANHEGISGSLESKAFSDMPPMQQSLAAALSHRTLMGVIPSIIEHDFPLFVRSVAFIQKGIGEYFAPFQGGERFTSRPVAALISSIKGRWPGVGVGQSSWGPSAFVFCQSPSVANEIVTACEIELLTAGQYPGLKVSAHKPRNHGAVIEHINL